MTSTYPPTTIRGTEVTYLPLTTQFEAADACSSYYIGVGSNQINQYTTSLKYLDAWNAGYQYYINTTAGCFPAEVVSSAKASHDALVTRYISQYVLAQADVVPTVELAPFSCLRGWTSVYSTLEGESSAMTACCPTGYEASIDYYGTLRASITCMSRLDISTSGRITYAENLASVNIITATETIPSTYSLQTEDTPTIFEVRASPMSGYNFPMASATQSSVESSSQQKSGLSTGAKAGIGVGVGVGALLIIGALIFFLRSRRRPSAGSEGKPEDMQAPETTMIAELRGESHRPVHELHNRTDKPELVGSYTPTNELAGTHGWPPQELDASGDRPARHGSQSST